VKADRYKLIAQWYSDLIKQSSQQNFLNIQKYNRLKTSQLPLYK